MKIALAGKPGCGRSTLFRALAGSADADTGKPLTVKVPDHRLDFLESIHNPAKKTHATVVFFDVPSPSVGAKNLALLRNAAVITIGLDNYALGDTVNDFNEIETELILNDMALCEKRLARLTKESKGKSREALLLTKLLEHMEIGKPLRILEIQSEVAAEQAEKYGWLAVECIKAAGISFELRCPLDGEYQVGDTWSETH